MNLILTSDFPQTPVARVVARMKAAAERPRIAWIPPSTDAARAQFDEALERFGALGFDSLECCDIDDEADPVQLAYLHEFDIIYLGDGDAIRFRANMLRTGLAGRLRQCAAVGRLIVAAGAGAQLLTPNVSLQRLLSEPLDEVMRTRGRFDTIGAVRFEVLPHADRGPADVADRLAAYSARVDGDVVAIADGGALFPTAPDDFQHEGAIVRHRRGAPVT